MSKLIGTLGLQILERTEGRLKARIIHDETRRAIDLTVELHPEGDMENLRSYIQQQLFEQQMPVFFLQPVLDYLRKASESPEIIDVEVYTFTMEKKNQLDN
ncbi:MAG: hypothetical protein A4E53_00598 [Pelotomaculum sp. PtaB.Bin104]|nr:MAG: hypothetical protein A4E53_00598 [Pelotomaculum sp. PtaB.Bin104]